MPTMYNGTHLLIIHKIVGRDPKVVPLGDMAVETALMLEAHYLSEQATRTGIDSTNTIENAKKDRTNLNWLTRAYKAAQLAEPPISSEFGQLTQHGQYLSEVAYEVMDQCYNFDPNYATPHLMPDPDDWFIQARIPIRALRALKAFATLIRDAPMLNNLTTTPPPQWDVVVKQFKAQHSPKPDQFSIPSQDPQDPQFTPLPQLLQMDSPVQLDLDNQMPQEFTSVTISAQDMLDPTKPQKQITIIPTSIFGQRARTDVKHLLRHNLLDVRVIRHGGRGRPKQGVILSPIGEKLVDSEIVKAIK
jgi:hypothetical protein